MQGAATSRQAAEVTLSATQTDSDAAARARTRNDRGECSSASPVHFVAWPGLDDQRGDGTGRKRDSHFDRAWGCGSQWQAVVDVITGNSRRRLVSTRSPVFARHWATTGPRPSCTTWPRGFPTRLPHLLQFILSVSRPAYPRKLSSIIARTMTSNSVSAPRRYCRTFTTATCPDPARLACGSQCAARLWCGNPPINGPSNVSNVVATESTCWPSAWKFRHAVRRSPLPRPAPRLTM